MADEPSYETHHEETTHKKKKKKKSSKRQTLDVSVNFVEDASDRAAPVVGYFPTGFDPLDSPENRVRVFRHKRHANRMELVVSPTESSLEFVGKSYVGEAAAPQICNYAVGVLDKESQTLRIVPIAANKVFRLEPHLAEKESTHAEPSEVTGATSTGKATGKVERKMADLTNMFGARKDKVQQKRLQNLMEQMNNDEPQPEHISATQNYESEVENEAEGSLGFQIIPPHDLTADAPERAYPLNQIIPRGERPYLLNILDDLKNKKKYPSFVANRMHKLNSLNDEEKEEFACILSYITHLITFWESYNRASRWKHGQNKAGENRKSIPQIVYQKLMGLFMNSESNVLSTEKHELLVGYILVLTLFADNFQCDTTDIAKDLKMTWPKLKLYYLQLGCKAAGTFVTLPVPLQIPDLIRKTKNQRRQ
ncbi:DNA-directed RNA polymerase I subunit rpa49 [Rhynchospora pubera]|uniref:DNA-directed RNA polymerase I subunit rpa49 n=1 Tax=Rhynchospora pubera TaxID=906938 RepID=A0AAV8HAU1_9POAL|nr:DNA-directed RNA polymerase I subunit rpa49 [Rhynchospora pubera]